MLNLIIEPAAIDESAKTMGRSFSDTHFTKLTKITQSPE
jgi:hypothetical protein